ncbi:MAG: S8 family serine peptidase, partial [Candidatus Poseidoniaceae archaeon]|nr:S8 family serine peptidase [Candidatus Poseidoniaceae archaeon]
WDGWPIAHDPRSLNDWLVDGETYPAEQNSWFADTSTQDGDSDSDDVLDDSGLNISNITSISGIYRLGEHPDGNLQSRVGDDVPVLLVDTTTAYVYDTVYVDLDGDDSFSDEIPMSRGNETAGLDLNDDGLWDRSAGMIYFIADGNTSLQYAPTLAARKGYADRIPANGDLVAFMVNEGSGPAGNHGTLCASAVAAQAVVSNGKVQGMAPNASIIAVANYYNGGSPYDAWRFVAEGPDGIIDSGDEAQIGSFSFGYSSTIDAGSDFSSLYLDWLTRVHSRNTTYMVALGNGGHGYGTVASPGGAAGIMSVGAASSKIGQPIGDTWGDMAMWTNRGPNSQGRMDPDIVAIGWSATGDTTLNEKTNANSATATWGGTSLATPLAAGLMALVFEAYHDEHGFYPDSQVIRDLVMSTARDLAQDPLVQGGGWFDVARAVRTIQSQNDTWWAEPAALMPGENDGAHRVANSNWMISGQTSVHNLTFHNPTSSVQRLNFSAESWQATSHEEFSWLSNSSMGWDGHQSSRPDLVIPILIHNDSNNTRIANDSTLVRARSALHPLAFDGDQNRQYENRIFLYMYRWNDSDGDGLYWNDSNNDSFVQDGEWSSSEVSLMTSFTYSGPQAEVKISDPWEEDCDGILLAISREETRTGHIDPTPVSIDITGFSPTVDPWLSASSSMWIPAASSRNLSVSVSVPMGTEAGLKQSGIRVDDGRGRDWLLPVVTTVAGEGPISWIPPAIDGNLSNQSLYRETWIQGAQRWGWRAESGDWKAFAVDWPVNMTDGSIIIDVDWPDNGHTDIDAFWLSEISHPFSTDDPDAYGMHGMHVETGSSIEHAGSGIWRRQTSTGGDRELLSAEATPGHKILLLHSTMHGVLTNDNPINVTIGYANALQGNLSTTVVNWSLGDFNDSVIIASTADVEIDDVSGYGWTEPMRWANESIFQDTPGSLSTSSYIRNITLVDIEYLRVQIDTNNPGDDLDLYLYRDKNGNGQIDWSSEKMESSGNGDSNELCEADTPADGLWWIVVHGYDVPSNNSTFWLSVKMIGGYNLVVDGYVELNSTEILSRWPTGATALGGVVPERAWQVNYSASRPQAAGIWNGYISLQIEGGGAIEIGYEYRLMEIPANVVFTMPMNGSFHNGSEPISARIWDIGGGFNLSEINLDTSRSLNLSNHSLNVSGLDVEGNRMNLSTQFLNLTNDVVLSELWLNFTLPEDDLDHHFILNVTDFSGFYSSSELFVTHDSVEPWFQAQGLGDPTTLFNQTFWNLSILGEPELDIEVAGVQAQVSLADSSLYSELNLSWPSTELNWYNLTVGLPVEGANLIFINASDKAQNQAQSSFVVIRDTISPMLEMRSEFEHTIINTSSLMFEYKVEPGAEIWISGEMVTNPENMGWNQFSISTDEGEFTITMTARDDAGNWADSEMTFTVDSIYPALQWLEPEVNASLTHRVVPLAWGLSENASMELRLDGDDWSTLPRGLEGRNSWVFELSELEEHTFCLRATDDGRNAVIKCLDVTLPTEVYTPTLFAPWDGTWVNTSNVTAELYLGPGQTWDLSGLNIDEHGTGLGGIVNITFPLLPGENILVLQAQGMGIQAQWELIVHR